MQIKVNEIKNLIGVLFMFISAFFIIGCSSDDDSSNNSEYLELARNRIIAGEWMVTFFLDEGQDRTLEVEEYSFNFLNDNSITVTHDTDNYVGSWNLIIVDDDTIEFNLMFDVANANILHELNKRWDTQYILDNRIILRTWGINNSKILHFSKD